MAETICVIHLTASAPCTQLSLSGKCPVVQKGSSTAHVHAAHHLAPKRKCLMLVALEGKVIHLNKAPKNDKGGKLHRRVLNLNLPVHFINGLDQVRRLHCTESNFTTKPERCRFALCKAVLLILCNTK